MSHKVKTLQQIERPDAVYLKMDHEDIVAFRKATVPLLPAGNYIADSRGSDQCLYRAKPIPVDDMELDMDQKAVFDQVLSFFAEREKYLKLNFRHKRGILMYGAPGTGKTTLVRAILNEFIARGAISIECGVGDLTSAIANCRKNTDTPIIWVQEDIDQLDRGDEQHLTEVLDGMNGIDNDNILFLATSNYIDRVSMRLRNRPGRFDEKIEVGYPSAPAREAYIRSLVKEESNEADIKLIVKLSEGMTVAHIKELVVKRVIYKMPDVELKDAAKSLKAMCSENDEETDARKKVMAKLHGR